MSGGLLVTIFVVVLIAIGYLLKAYVIPWIMEEDQDDEAAAVAQARIAKHRIAAQRRLHEFRSNVRQDAMRMRRQMDRELDDLD